MPCDELLAEPAVNRHDGPTCARWSSMSLEASVLLAMIAEVVSSTCPQCGHICNSIRNIRMPRLRSCLFSCQTAGRMYPLRLSGFVQVINTPLHEVISIIITI